MGQVGRFTAVDAVRYPRRSRVIVRTRRGLELGEVLIPPDDGDDDRTCDCDGDDDCDCGPHADRGDRGRRGDRDRRDEPRPRRRHGRGPGPMDGPNDGPGDDRR